MVELGTRCTTERVQIGNSPPTVVRAAFLSRHPHATFCGSRRWVTAVGDPVLVERFLRSTRANLWHNGNRRHNRPGSPCDSAGSLGACTEAYTAMKSALYE